MHLGGDNAGRFHIVIDMEKDRIGSLDVDEVPLEVYRVNCAPTGHMWNFLTSLPRGLQLIISQTLYLP